MDLTQKQIDDIDEMIQDDMTFEQISRSLGIPEAQCLSILMTVGVENWKPKIVAYVLEKQNRLLANQEKLLSRIAELTEKQTRIDAQSKTTERVTTVDIKKRLGIEQG